MLGHLPLSLTKVFNFRFCERAPGMLPRPFGQARPDNAHNIACGCPHRRCKYEASNNFDPIDASISYSFTHSFIHLMYSLRTPRRSRARRPFVSNWANSSCDARPPIIAIWSQQTRTCILILPKPHSHYNILSISN
jgi:hypothetical protein